MEIMNQNLFSKKKKLKKIGIAIIAILTIIIFLRNVRFQSVSEYKAQQQSMVDEYSSNSEKQSGDVTTNSKFAGEDIGELNNGSTSSEIDIDTVDMSENSSINNYDGQITDQHNMYNNSAINGISSNGSDSNNIAGDNSGGTISNNDSKDNNSSPGSEIQYVTCTIEIRCDALSNNMSKWTNKISSIPDNIPSDGIILEKTTATVKNGSTAYDVLNNETKRKNIQVVSSFSWAFNTYYIQRIWGIGEKDAGDLSGWIYKINGQTLPYAISTYKVQDGDVISLLYTCNMGLDLE